MADSLYTPDLFKALSGEPLQVLTSDKHASRKAGDGRLPDLLSSHPHASVPLDELDLAHGFALEQHAPATRKAYRSDFALFAAWCSVRGLSACPAAPETICAFIADEAERGTGVATITRRIAAIRYAHALKGSIRFPQIWRPCGPP